MPAGLGYSFAPTFQGAAEGRRGGTPPTAPTGTLKTLNFQLPEATADQSVNAISPLVTSARRGRTLSDTILAAVLKSVMGQDAGSVLATPAAALAGQTPQAGAPSSVPASGMGQGPRIDYDSNSRGPGQTWTGPPSSPPPSPFSQIGGGLQAPSEARTPDLSYLTGLTGGDSGPRGGTDTPTISVSPETRITPTPIFTDLSGRTVPYDFAMRFLRENPGDAHRVYDAYFNVTDPSGR